ncbi:MAG: Fur family transcriptional regulator, ferric uptake regulator [Solirubrobacteraceae bacterium]|jgi:Fur family ferric uptake transcriptional regulator|nr:Fur family transcriptional regulator, ferric uptake regulator [Solirubrobacteraceae bacterium]
MSESVRSGWTTHAEDVLQAAGHRRGSARDAIVRLLAAEPCALTPIDIEARLRGTGTRVVSRASIYRILELLHEHGLVQRLDLGQGVAHYEVVDPSGDHHHHVVCDECGKVTPFDDRALERSLVRLAERLNVDVRDHEVVLRGACDRCAAA